MCSKIIYIVVASSLKCRFLKFLKYANNSILNLKFLSSTDLQRNVNIKHDQLFSSSGVSPQYVEG